MGLAAESVETDVGLSQEISKAMEHVEDMVTGEKMAQPDSAPDMGSEDEASEETAAKQPKKDSSIRTLFMVLQEAGLQDYVPKQGEQEKDRLQRLRSLASPMQAFSAHVRLTEGILSRPSIEGRVKISRHSSPQCTYEHLLAEARHQFHCNAQRQSRHALWFEFSERVAQVVQPSETESGEIVPEDAEIAEAVQQVQHLRPSSSTLADGSRACQVLIVRPFKAGGEHGPLRLAIVVGAWSGGKTKTGKRAKDHVWPEGQLPVSSATRVHVRLIIPTGDKNDQGHQLAVASALSPVVPLDPHDGSILMQVNEGRYTVEFGKFYVKVWLKKEPIKALAKLCKAGLPLSAKKKDDDGINKTFLTEDDFQRTATGTKNMQKHLEQMLRDYEEHFQKLVSKKGEVKLTKDVVVSWSELVARSSSYFKKYVKNSAYWKGMSADAQKQSHLGYIRIPCGTTCVDTFWWIIMV